mgnify:CR=1 FL=1
MKIGNITIEKTAALAPMAGVADTAFRSLCREFGAAYVVGELASAKGLTMGDKKTARLLQVTEAERPMAVQLFGDDPAIMAKAAEKALGFSPDVLDINMGCPAPKVVGGGGGSALMKDPALASRIVKEVISAAGNTPVTVKFRKGWDERSVNAVDFAKSMEQSGAAALAIHGRTRVQMYAPPVDVDIIRQVKQAVSVPVIGNGDVADVESCKAMYEQTGCDLVMIGRGSLGAPWVFSRIRAYFLTGELLPEPSLTEKMEVMLRHVRRICKENGEAHGMKEARKHAAWYMKGLRGAASYRKDCGELCEFADLERLAQKVLQQNPDF